MFYENLIFIIIISLWCFLKSVHEYKIFYPNYDDVDIFINESN